MTNKQLVKAIEKLAAKLDERAAAIIAENKPDSTAEYYRGLKLGATLSMIYAAGLIDNQYGDKCPVRDFSSWQGSLMQMPKAVEAFDARFYPKKSAPVECVQRDDMIHDIAVIPASRLLSPASN